MSTTSLPVLSQTEKGDIAIHLLVEMVKTRGIELFSRPNNGRREAIRLAKEFGIDPNKLLSLLEELMRPNIEATFKPISAEDIAAYDKEREEQRKKKELAKATPQRSGQSD